MDEYASVKKSSLKFKGEKRKKKKKEKRTKREKSANEEPNDLNEYTEDAADHGGWWKVEKYDHIKEDIAIEFLSGAYARALANGMIVRGDFHPPGESPDEEEIFTAICASTNQLALKSGFGRYLGIDSKNRLIGTSEAIGERELFLPVFEENQLALCAFNGCFISPEESDDPRPQIVARAEKAGQSEMIRIRVLNNPRDNN